MRDKWRIYQNLTVITWNGQLVCVADTPDRAAQIIHEHNAHEGLVEAVQRSPLEKASRSLLVGCKVMAERIRGWVTQIEASGAVHPDLLGVVRLDLTDQREAAESLEKLVSLAEPKPETP